MTTGLFCVTASDGDDGRTWVSWWTNPAHRRQGLATREVRAFLVRRRVEVWALIRPWNRASIALAARLGFTLVAADEENLTYRWTP